MVLESTWHEEGSDQQLETHESHDINPPLCAIALATSLPHPTCPSVQMKGGEEY